MKLAANAYAESISSYQNNVNQRAGSHSSPALGGGNLLAVRAWGQAGSAMKAS